MEVKRKQNDIIAILAINDEIENLCGHHYHWWIEFWVMKYWCKSIKFVLHNIFDVCFIMQLKHKLIWRNRTWRRRRRKNKDKRTWRGGEGGRKRKRQRQRKGPPDTDREDHKQIESSTCCEGIPRGSRKGVAFNVVSIFFNCCFNFAFAHLLFSLLGLLDEYKERKKERIVGVWLWCMNRLGWFVFVVAEDAKINCGSARMMIDFEMML